MPLTDEQKINIKQVITNSLRNKFQNYNPEPASMPFHFRLLGKDRIALYSFIHSLSTNFGTSIFEPVAKSLAQLTFASAELQQKSGMQISSEAQRVIQNMMDDLTTAAAIPDKLQEIQAIRNVCRQGEMKTV
jgi:type II restriction enzyme